METLGRAANGEVVLDVIEASGAEASKTRLTESDLERQQAYFEEMMAKGEAGLSTVRERLALIQNEKQRLS